MVDIFSLVDGVLMEIGSLDIGLVEIGLIISLFFNLTLFHKIERQKKEIQKIRGGVQLSREELEKLRSRLSRIKGL
jgi:di/tricarboxylate transporter